MGKIQRQDVKTSAEHASVGSNDSNLIQDNQIYVTADSLNKTLYQAIVDEDIGGGGGGGGGTSNTYTLSGILSEILSDEADNFIPAADQLTDDFNDEAKGTKVTCAQSNSALRLTALTGTYERVKMVTKVMGTVDGGAVVSAQALAPKATALSPSSTSTSVTFKFDGDVTNMFANTKKVVIVRKVISGDTGYDGKVGYAGALATSGAIAELAVSGAPSFSGGETTLVISNPDAIDLDFALSASDFPTKLRVIPWDYTYQVKSATGSSYETMAIDNLSALDTVRIPGENFFSEIGAMTGSCLRQVCKFSPSGQHGLTVLLERTAGNYNYRFYRSSNYGVTWSEQASTKSDVGANDGEETADSDKFQRSLNPGCVAVADNGKWFVMYTAIMTARGIRGAYGDTSSSAITDAPSTGTDAGNNTGEANGAIFRSSTFDIYANIGLAADLTDLSYIAVAGAQSNNLSQVRWYSNGGATHLGLSSTTYSHANNEAGLIFVNGSSSSHRTTLIRRNNSSGFLAQTYWDQGSFTAVASADINGIATLISNGSVSNGRAIIYYRSSSHLYYATSANIGFGLTPSWTVDKLVISNSSGISIDRYNGFNAENDRNLIKTEYSRSAQNPVDEKHSSIAIDLRHPDSVNKATLIEIPDVTAFNGIGISQYSTDGVRNLRQSTSFSARGQSFTATASTPKLRTASFLVYQSGTIASGNTLSAKLYATSAGLPTGAALATASNTYDPTLITKNTSGQWCHFNFANYTLVNTTVYVVMLESAFTIDGSNFLQCKSSTANPYASGSCIEYDGSVYALTSGFDLCFMISDAYITDVGKGIESGANRAAFGFHDQESQIQNITSTTAQLTFRRASSSSDAMKQLSGHPYRRVLTWGASGTQSTLTSSVVAGYAPTNFDENLVLAVAPGYDDSKRQNTTTGVLDADNMLEDRSGLDIVTAAYTNITAADLATDASFQSGFALDLDGSSEYIQYTDRPEFDLYFNKPFCIEAELNVSSLSATRTFLAQLDGAASNGWVFQLTASGQLQILMFVGGSPVVNRVSTASDFVTGTYYVVRATYDGLGGGVKLWKATSYNGTFTELSYTTTVNFSSGNTSSGVGLTVGRYDGGQYFAGKIGYVKFVNGASSFNYSGYKNQAPLVGHQNVGTKILAENKLGENSLTSGTNFDNAGIISGDVANAAMVDSNDVLVSFKHTIAGTKGNMLHFKWTGNRVSTRDVSALEAVNIRYEE